MKTFLSRGLFLLILSAGLATRGADDGKKFIDSLGWIKGPGVGDLKGIAEVKLPEGYIFTGTEGAQKLLQAYGNRPSGIELGLLAPTNLEWFVVFEFNDSGYVKDDDKDKLDADKMLKSIKAGTEEANKYRKEHGSAPLNIIGWEIPPKYNEQTHNLEWAIKAESEGHMGINYNTRVLGRKGVMKINLVVDANALQATLPAYTAMLGGYSFKTGESYAEFKQGDKIAKYGLAALITGGAAAVAVKTGLFAYLLLGLKKLWKLIVLAVVGAAAWIKKLITGDRSKSDGS